MRWSSTMAILVGCLAVVVLGYEMAGCAAQQNANSIKVQTAYYSCVASTGGKTTQVTQEDNYGHPYLATEEICQK